MTMHDTIIPDWPAPPRVRALVTTRLDGVSGGNFASFNLAEHVGDDPAAVESNRKILRQHLPGDPFWLAQVHGIRCVDAASASPGAAADACVAHAPGQVCVVMTADCLPVLLCDTAGSAVGVAHAGWRGLAAGVIESAVAAMACPASGLLAWLGPAIGPRAFEVGKEVRAAFVAVDAAAADAFTPQAGDKWHCDLYRLARQRLNACGVGEISGGGLCTFSDADRFYSFRRDRQTGRMASLIWLEEPGL
jgi:YfiH family protein